MKQGIHPEYRPVAFQDASTGKLFVTRSTATSERTAIFEASTTWSRLFSKLNT